MGIKHKYLRIASILLAVILATTALCSCGGSKESASKVSEDDIIEIGRQYLEDEYGGTFQYVGTRNDDKYEVRAQYKRDDLYYPCEATLFEYIEDNGDSYWDVISDSYNEALVLTDLAEYIRDDVNISDEQFLALTNDIAAPLDYNTKVYDNLKDAIHKGFDDVSSDFSSNSEIRLYIDEGWFKSGTEYEKLYYSLGKIFSPDVYLTIRVCKVNSEDMEEVKEFYSDGTHAGKWYDPIDEPNGIEYKSGTVCTFIDYGDWNEANSKLTDIDTFINDLQ